MQKILRALAKKDMTFIQLQNTTGLPERALLEILSDLASEYKIMTNGKKYLLVDNVRVLVGEYHQNSMGKGKIRTESVEYNISNTEFIFPGDTAIVRVRDYNNVEILKVIKRAKKPIMGELVKKETNYCYFDIGNNMRSLPYVLVQINDLKGAVEGSICLLSLYFDELNTALVLECIGHRNDPNIEVLRIAASCGLRNEFPEEAINEARATETEVDSKNLVGRVDFTNDLVITIDGLDAKDLDDAISCVRLDYDCYRLSVYIADVAFYVQENSAIDKEAALRGTSAYLGNTVIPMLPRELSNGICSLNPHVNRLVLACIMDIDKYGEVFDYRIQKGYIKTKYRMDYDTVNEIFKGIPHDEYNDVIPMLMDMRKLSDIISKSKVRKGTIDFETKELKFVYSGDDVVDSYTKKQGRAENLIEDFMVMANETVAKHCTLMKYPALYRVHGKPDKKNLQAVMKIFSHLGIKINTRINMTPHDLQKIANDLKKRENFHIYFSYLLRSMQRAKYSDVNEGHYGLQLSHYLHFTSPIRRYPDTLVHRVLHELMLGEQKDLNKKANHFSLVMADMATQTSNCEQKAVEAERAVCDLNQAILMSKHLGKEFKGFITSITSFGMFVELSNGCEGLVFYGNIPQDVYFHQESVSLLGRNGDVVYNIGDEVLVKVIDANRTTRKVDLAVINHHNKRRGGSNYGGSKKQTRFS